DVAHEPNPQVVVDRAGHGEDDREEHEQAAERHRRLDLARPAADPTPGSRAPPRTWAHGPDEHDRGGPNMAEGPCLLKHVQSARTRDRTWDLQFRKLSLYPTELCEHDRWEGGRSAAGPQEGVTCRRRHMRPVRRV